LDITTLSFIQLVEQGKLSLEDEVAKYLPEFEDMNVALVYEKGKMPWEWPNKDTKVKPAENKIKIHQLMSMTSGLSYNILWSEDIKKVKEETSNQASTREIVKAIAKGTLLFEPGTRYSYSLGHDVLVAVVEVVTDMRFSEYMKKNVFEPLGIRDMYYQVPKSEEARVASRYNIDENGHLKRDVINVTRVTDQFESGGGGLSCTVDEYMKIVEALSNDGIGGTGAQILSRESIDEMRKNRLNEKVLEDFHGVGKKGYGYGLGVRTLIDKSTSKSPVGEFGWDGAAGAYVLVDPENHIGIFYAHSAATPLDIWNIVHPTIRDKVYEAIFD